MDNTLLLVDGSSYLYRAFHALPDLRSPDGYPTGAMHGMVNMLRRLRADFPAAYIACVFDAKGKTFRDDMYPEYKATRASMPEDLGKQIAPIHEVVRYLGWPILMVEGVEADDVIGTLATQATARGMNTVVSTGDKDLAQLVNDKVMLINTMSNEKLDEAGVIAKFGVPPNRIIDYLTLIGDTVDNVPGVAKCGPKTALKWLALHDSLDGVMQNAGSIGGAVGANLQAALEWLPKGRELITVKTDCDLVGHVVSFEETLIGRPEDKDALRDFFQRYGFKTMLKDMGPGNAGKYGLPGAPAAAPAAGMNSPEGASGTQDGMPVIKGEYETVTTMEALETWLALIDTAALTSVDTETTSLDPMTAQMVGISLSVEAGKGAYIPLAHRYAGVPEQLDREAVLARMKPWLEDPDKPKLGQNLKYDSHIFENHGIRLRGIVHDTLLQSYVFESHKPHDMDTMAMRHLGYTTIPFVDVCGKGVNQICFDQVELERATEYAAEDSDITLRLHQKMIGYVEGDKGLDYIYRKIELPTSVVLQKIERNGVLVDAELLGVQSGELAKRIMELEQQAYEMAGGPFNLGSPKQIGEIFFGKLQLPVIKKTATGAPSTDEEVLQKLAEDYPLPKVLLEHRGLSKLKSTYTDKLPKMVNAQTGRVHTNYAQAVAITGRLASSDPNLQNIPVRNAEGRRIREAFVAAPGNVIVSADYSQIELRIMAHISGDEAMLRAFAAGEDIHRATAAEIFNVAPEDVQGEQRRYAKVINFGLIYGMSAFGLAQNLGIERGAAGNYIERYFARFAGVKRYMDETRLAAKERGYVETVFGRRLWLPEINSPNGPRRAGAERAAINAPMQGTAADLIKLVMIAVQDWIEQAQLGTRMVMQVHDELVLEVPEGELELVKTKLPELMAGVATLKVPLVAETGVGRNWQEAH